MNDKSRLSSAAILVWLLASVGLTAFTADPILAGLSLTCACLNRVLMGRGEGGRFLILPLGFLTVSAAVNPLFTHRGATELLFINGSAVTLEAILAGAVTGAVLGASFLYFATLGDIFDDSRLLSLLGVHAPKTALVLSSALHLLPGLRRRYGEIGDARRAIGAEYGEGGEKKRGGTLRVWSALLGLAFEDAAEQAALMKARGFGDSPSGRISLPQKSSRALSLCAVLLACLALAAVAAGTFSGLTATELYPTVRWPSSAACIPVYLCAAGLFLLPSFIKLYGDIKWHFLKSKI